MPDLPPHWRPERRHLLATGLALAAAVHVPGVRADNARHSAVFAGLLRQGGCAVLIRHAQTEAGTGDPPGFRLDQCSTQRQLSLAGRETARRMGRWFEARKLEPAEARSSQWCRCRDTADLAFGRHTPWPALNSTFTDSSLQPAQTRALRERLAQIATGQFEVWVTHQVNMTHLAHEYPSTGEAFVVDASGRLKGRMVFE